MPLGPRRPLLSAALVVLATVVSTLVAGIPGLPRAVAAGATTLTLTAPPQYAGRDAVVTVGLSAGPTDGEGPVAGADVVLERWDGVAWQPAGTVTTDDTGAATLALTVSRSPARNQLRASYAGDMEHEPATATFTLPLRALPTTTSLTGPTSVVDERSIVLRITWVTTTGEPVAGTVRLQRYLDGAWRTVTRRTTNASGIADIGFAPRNDGRYRAVSTGLPWAAGSVSRLHVVDNLPPGVPVRLPAGAPRPRITLPVQPRATAPGAAAVISRIPDRVWRSMVGRSWHRGCPVGRSGLRLLRINYWDYQGYRRRGEVVAAVAVVGQMAGALRDMYAARLPIRSMYRVDRFGWSRRLNGADDYRSMAAGNTSAFNCRWVVGRPGVRSPHTWGRSLDVNTWENPYRSSHGWVPNAWWPWRAHARVAWRSRTHRVVRIMAGRGLRWTYGRSDSQHFDAVPRGGRLVVVPGCEDVVCH